MPVFSVVPRNSLNKELIFLASGTAWLAVAGAGKLVAVRREAALNAWRSRCWPRSRGNNSSFRDGPPELGFTRVQQHHCPSRQKPTWMDQTSDVQLHIGESRDSGFARSARAPE